MKHKVAVNLDELFEEITNLTSSYDRKTSPNDRSRGWRRMS